MTLAAYKTVRFERGKIPEGLRREHRLAEGVHGELRVIEGEVTFVDRDGARRVLGVGAVQAIAPGSPHHLEDADDATIEITFLR